MAPADGDHQLLDRERHCVVRLASRRHSGNHDGEGKNLVSAANVVMIASYILISRYSISIPCAGAFRWCCEERPAQEEYRTGNKAAPMYRVPEMSDRERTDGMILAIIPGSTTTKLALSIMGQISA
jgi:hypothetical protein